MNSEKRSLLFGKVTNYVRTRSKAVRFDVPPNLHNSLDLRRAWRQLTQDEFRPKSAWQSEVLAERYDAEAPIMMLTVKSDDIWNLVYSDEWEECSSLRICDGELLQRIVEQLFLLVESKRILTFKVAKFDRCGLVTKGGVLMNGCEQSSTPIPEDVKVTFTYYAVNLHYKEGEFPAMEPPSRSPSSPAASSTESDTTLDSALQPSAECVFVCPPAVPDIGAEGPDLHRSQSVPNMAPPRQRPGMTSECQKPCPVPRGRRLSVVRSVNVFGAIITISTASSTELDPIVQRTMSGPMDKAPLPSITVALPLLADTSAKSNKSLKVTDGKGVEKKPSKNSKRGLGVIRSRGNMTSKNSAVAAAKQKSKIVFRPSVEEIETQVVSFIDNRLLNRNDEDGKANSHEGTSSTPPGFRNRFMAPGHKPSSGRASSQTPPGQEVNMWCRSSFSTLPPTWEVKSAANDLAHHSKLFKPVTMSISHCYGQSHSAEYLQIPRPTYKPPTFARIHPLEQAGRYTHCLTASDEYLLVPDIPPDPMPEARAAARRALHYARHGHAIKPFVPNKVTPKCSLRNFLQSKPCAKVVNNLPSTAKSGLSTQLVRSLVFCSTPRGRESQDLGSDVTSSTLNNSDVPLITSPQLDTTRVNRRYSLDCLRRERLRQCRERPPTASLGRRLQKEAIKQFLEAKLGGRQVEAPPPKQGPRTRRLSTMVPTRAIRLAHSNRPPTPPPLPPIPSQPPVGKLARAKLLSGPPAGDTSDRSRSRTNIGPVPGHQRPVFEPPDVVGFQAKLMQTLNQFVVRKEVITRDKGKPPIVTVTINKPINFHYD